MNKMLLYVMLSLSSSVSAFAMDAPNTEEQKTLYAVGIAVSQSLAVFDLSAAELEYVKLGMMDAISGKKTAVDLAAYRAKVQELARVRRQAMGEKEAAAGKEFADRAAMEKGAVKTGSGMIYLPLSEGKGEHPAANDTVKVTYRGILVDGREFDSSSKRGKPGEFRLDSVIKCWTEGIQKMKVGGKAKLVCPPETAYGSSGAGEMILPSATIAFEVELLEVVPVALPGAAGPATGAPAAKPATAKGQPVVKAAP